MPAALTAKPPEASRPQFGTLAALAGGCPFAEIFEDRHVQAARRTADPWRDAHPVNPEEQHLRGLRLRVHPTAPLNVAVARSHAVLNGDGKGREYLREALRAVVRSSSNRSMPGKDRATALSALPR